MQVAYAQLKDRSPAMAAAIADARSARNLQTRRERAARSEEIDAERARRRRRQKETEELLARLRLKVRVKMPGEHRPKVGRSTARKLFQRASRLLPGTVGSSNARGSDGLYSIHFGFTPRGFGSTKGRRWRAGEAERAARYVTREEGLEGGEHGWWSNVAADRTELIGFFRTVEAFEKHDRSNANVYVSEIIALPAELTARQRRLAVRRICRFFEQRGLGYVAAMHLPDRAGDQRNFHCHILYSLRPCERHGAYDWSFVAAKEADINTPDGIAARRRMIVRNINATLHAAGIDKRYTHLSNKARRMAVPEPNVGQVGTWIARRLAAVEAREALLRKVQSLAGRLHLVLTHGSARLARLGAEAEHRRAEATRKAAAVRAATARLQAGTARLATAREDMEYRLAQRHAAIGSVCAAASTTIAHHTDQLSRDLHARKRAIHEAGGTATARVRRTGRYAELSSMLGGVDAVRTICARCTPAAAAATRKRLQTCLSAVRLCETGAAASLARTRYAALNVAQDVAGQLAASAARANRHLGRAADRARTIEALRRKRETLAKRDAGRHLYLSARRGVAFVRVKAMRPKTAAERASTLAAVRDSLLARLRTLRGSVASRANGADLRLRAAQQRGRRLFAGGLGKGPQQMGRPANAGEQLVPPPAAPASPAGSRSEPKVSPAGAAAASSRKNGVHERLREIVRKREPDGTAGMFPPPGNRSPRPADALLVVARQMALLRAEVRRREKQVREALRKRALERLSHLDIPVHVNADGYYGIARGSLMDEEMRVLLDPSVTQEVQRFLADIARQQRSRATTQVRPVSAPQARSDPADIDPAILAAASRKSKERGN